MKINGSANPAKTEPTLSKLAQISPWQQIIELHARRLREQLRLSELDPLEHDRALNLIPNCEVWALKNIPGLPFEIINHFRIAGYQIGAFAFRDKDGDHRIVFNDTHQPAEVRVHLMEEFFHIRLGHKPDVVRLYPSDGRHRTHSEAKEDEAYGCGIASLVPLGGLEELLRRGLDMRRIAEHFVVPIDVIQLRVAALNLGNLIPSQRCVPLPAAASVKRETIA